MLSIFVAAFEPPRFPHPSSVDLHSSQIHELLCNKVSCKKALEPLGDPLGS